MGEQVGAHGAGTRRAPGLVARARKAFVAAASAFVAVAAAGLWQAAAGPGGLSGESVAGVLGAAVTAAVVAGWATFRVPNAPARPALDPSRFIVGEQGPEQYRPGRP